MKRTPTQTAKKKADLLFSQIIRSAGACEHCQAIAGVQLQCAHWISRRYSNTRTDFDNAFCLCAACHRWFTDNPTAFSDWAITKRGRDTYDRLREAANKHSEMDWVAELERLREVARREGLAA